MNNAAINTMYRALCGHMFSFPAVYTSVELPAHMVSLCLASAKRNCYPVSQSCVMFPTYPQEGLIIREGKGLTGGRDP